MALMPAGTRYSIRRFKPLRWRTFFLLFGALWALLLVSVALHGDEPPVGWGQAIALTPVVVLPLLFIFWLERLLSDQHVIVKPDGVLVAVPFRRLIRFDDIAYVRCLSLTEPTSKYWLMTLLGHKLVPAWDEPPNVELSFHKAIRLNLYPFRWCRQLQLTVDRPTEFVEALSKNVSVDMHNAAGMYARTDRLSTAEKLTLTAALLIVTLGIGYWVLFNGRK
jgi:hypothetical protein